MPHGFDEFDYAPKGPKAEEIREKERLEKLAEKGKVDRTAEYLNAIKIIHETTPLEVNAGEVQDTVLEDKLDFTNKQLEFRKYCDENNIPYNEHDPEQVKTMTIVRNNSPMYPKGSSSYRRNDKKEKSTLQPRPDNERDRKMGKILGDKLYKISEIFIKAGDDITNKGYLSQDPEIQQDCIRGADAFIEYLAPLFHDNFYGDWTDKFDPFVERLKVERHWTEEPEFIRKYRYELDLESGAVKDRHEYTHAYITGPKIVPNIVSVIKIADNIQFFGALFKNNRQTRYKQQLARDENRFDDQ